MGIASPADLTCRVRPDDPALSVLVESAAQSAGRPIRPLHLQALLQLPRCANVEGIVTEALVKPLLSELAHELPANTEWVVRNVGTSPRSLRFHPVDAGIVREVTKRFHYLRSPRLDGRAYGVSSPSNELVALCVSSPVDVERLLMLLRDAGRSHDSARVISRVFAFEGAPRNVISYLLSRAGRAERSFGVTDFVTYVNPNVGFRGSSYRASGWRLIGTEPGTTYRYVDGRYVTDRELAARFEAHDDAAFRSLLGGRFTVNAMALAPLLVFHQSLAQAPVHDAPAENAL